MKKIVLYNGQSLIELVIAIGMLAIILPALLTGIIASRSGKDQQDQRMQALTILKETEESVRSIRDRDWTTFAVDGTFHPILSGNIWTLATGSATVSGITRQVVIGDIYRDTNGAIVTSGGTLDPSTKKIDITISWSQPHVSSISSTTYLTRHDNNAYSQSTQSDFNAGTSSNAVIVSTTGSSLADDGQVQLGAGGGGGDWCVPSKSITTFDLPKNGVANAITAIEGTVFAGTGDNASGVSFQKINLTTSQDPPVATGAATFDGYKTNSVFGEANYAYLATDNNAKEVVMMSLTQYSDPPTNSKYKEVGSINLPGNGNADSVYVLNDKAYVSGGGKLYIYSLSADRTTATLLNSGYVLSGTGKKVVMGSSGQYVYVITNATTNNFEIINVTTPATPTRASITTLGSGQAGVDLYVNSSESLVYAALAYSAGKNNVYKVDISNKSAPSVSATAYSTSGMSPKGITVVTGNRVIVVGTGGTYQYQVLNTNTMQLCSPTSVLQYSTGVNGVASVLQSNGYAYSYIITGDSNSELKIILGGAGGQFVSTGTYTSSSFNPGFTTSYNRFQATVSKPSQTDITIKVGVAKAINGSCTGVTYTYLGPNGDPAQSFQTGTDPTVITGLIPLVNYSTYYNPGQCFRYQVYLSSTDSTSSPVLYDMSINYSP